jgi:hypothetical protein
MYLFPFIFYKIRNNFGAILQTAEAEIAFFTALGEGA